MKETTTLALGFADIPVITVRGASEGKTLVVTANIHGDEYEGVRAILETVEELDPAAMRGTLIAVPVANPPAFWNGSRCSPLDGLNLARVFPGKSDGAPTEQTAWHLGEHVISRADFYLDLHSGGVRWRMPSMVGYDSSDPRSKSAAMIFGAGVVWGHPVIPPGRTVSFCKERGIPFLYTEARGAGRIAPDDLEMMKRGIRNLLRYLGIVAGPYEGSAPARHLFGDGNVEAGINAPARGFFIPAVELLERVERGQYLGRLLELGGREITRFHAPVAGVIGLRREYPPVEKGEPLFLIAEEAAMPVGSS